MSNNYLKFARIVFLKNHSIRKLLETFGDPLKSKNHSLQNRLVRLVIFITSNIFKNIFWGILCAKNTNYIYLISFYLHFNFYLTHTVEGTVKSGKTGDSV